MTYDIELSFKPEPSFEIRSNCDHYWNHGFISSLRYSFSFFPKLLAFLFEFIPTKFDVHRKFFLVHYLNMSSFFKYYCFFVIFGLVDEARSVFFLAVIWHFWQLLAFNDFDILRLFWRYYATCSLLAFRAHLRVLRHVYMINLQLLQIIVLVLGLQVIECMIKPCLAYESLAECTFDIGQWMFNRFFQHLNLAWTILIVNFIQYNIYGFLIFFLLLKQI